MQSWYYFVRGNLGKIVSFARPVIKFKSILSHIFNILGKTLVHFGYFKISSFTCIQLSFIKFEIAENMMRQSYIGTFDRRKTLNKISLGTPKYQGWLYVIRYHDVFFQQNTSNPLICAYIRDTRDNFVSAQQGKIKQCVGYTLRNISR